MSSKPAAAAAAAASVAVVVAPVPVPVGARRRRGVDGDADDDGKRRSAKVAKLRLSVYDVASMKQMLPGLMKVKEANKILEGALQTHTDSLSTLADAVRAVEDAEKAKARAIQAVRDAKHETGAPAAAAAAGAAAAMAKDDAEMSQTQVMARLDEKFDDPSKHTDCWEVSAIPCFIGNEVYYYTDSLKLDVTRMMFDRMLKFCDDHLANTSSEEQLETVCFLALELAHMLSVINKVRRRDGGEVIKAWNTWWTEYGSAYFLQREYGVLALALAGAQSEVDWAKLILFQPVGFVAKTRVACDTWTACADELGAPASLTSALLARLIRLSAPVVAFSAVVAPAVPAPAASP